VKRGVVRATAPAKLILFGEHFVVYGAKALATAINRYLTVEISPLNQKCVLVEAENFPSLRFSQRAFFHLSSGGERVEECAKESEAESAGRRAEKSAEKWRGEKKEESFIYVRAALQYFQEKYDIPAEEMEGLRIKITSEIPISAGLGSSAATCVAMIAALNEYFGISSANSEDFRQEVSRDAREVERLVQGAASPTDTAVASHGGFVLVEGESVRKFELPSFELLVALPYCFPFDASLKLKTKHLVERVKAKKEKFPSIFSHFLKAASEITEEGVKALKNRDFRTFGMLLNMNHGLLNAVGVVPKNLGAFVATAKRLGALGAKVTGAGSTEELAVGSVLVLPQTPEDACLIEGALKAEGARVMRVKAGVEGLRSERI